MKEIEKKCLHELVSLRLMKIQWFQNYVVALGITLSDESTCKAGKNEYNNSFDISETTKICKIDVIFIAAEQYIGQIILYDKNGLLKKLGDDCQATGRIETFEIEDNERFFGCELDYGNSYLLGVTFIKWKVWV